MKQVDEFAETIIKYIKRQDFNGTAFGLKPNLINYIKEKAEEMKKNE